MWPCFFLDNGWRVVGVQPVVEVVGELILRSASGQEEGRRNQQCLPRRNVGSEIAAEPRLYARASGNAAHDQLACSEGVGYGNTLIPIRQEYNGDAGIRNVEHTAVRHLIIPCSLIAGRTAAPCDGKQRKFATQYACEGWSIGHGNIPCAGIMQSD